MMSTKTAVAVISAMSIVGVADSATVIQQSGSSDIKFEAGSYDSLVNNGTSVVTDNTDGTLTTTDENTGALNGSVVTYQINFATAGDYFLYFNVDAENAAGDSVFVNHGTGFDSTPGDSAGERWNGLDTGWNGLNNIGVGLGSTQADYTIPAGTPAYAWNVASPGTVSFAVRSREDGLTWNSFVFSTSSTESAADLNGLAFSSVVVPEPGSLALLALGGLLVARRR